MRQLGVSAALAVALALGLPSEGRAQGDEARYRITIAGLPIGTARLRVAIDETAYAVEADAGFRFLFWGGSGTARAHGAREGEALRPERYRVDYEGTRRPGGAEIAFADGDAVAFASFPEPPAEFVEGRIEIAPEHLAGVLDPLSALVIPVPDTADPETVCHRVLPVFNGFTRFDLTLAGAAGNGPEGLGCAARYRPVSGHRPDSRGVERMMRPDAFEIVLAPLGALAWAPSRIAVATRFGTVEVSRTD